MMFWFLAALLSAAVIALFAWPLVKDRRLRGAVNADLAVYRDQLSELEREVARGLLPESEAASARLEIQRRLLAAAAPAVSPASPGTGQGASWTALLLLVALPALAVALYLHLGRPGLPGQPLASRTTAPNGDQQLANLAQLLQTKLAADPRDPKAWAVLGRIEGELGHYQDSADAYGRAIARHQANGDTPDPELQSLYGEALSAASDGQVTPKARQAFAAALALDPKEPRARFYLALSDAQAGNLDMALKQWVALEADTPADAPWRAALEDQINAAARQLGRDPATLPGRAAQPPTATAGTAASGATTAGPTAQDLANQEMANAASMTDQQRAAFIDSMVAGLADRLKAQPNDVEGWLKLANAYDQLGRPADARAAWREAANRAPDRLDAQIGYASALAPLAEQSPLPADFGPVVDRIRKLAPNNGLGLYCAGLIARANGDKAAARALWLKVLPLIPEGTPQRKELEAKIAALGA
jgi:cytochrome c-type biogenesis protein CcmH